MEENNHSSPQERETPPGRKRLPWWAVAAAFATLAAFLGLVAWGLVNAGQNSLAVGRAAPDFTIATFDGETYNTSELRGRVIVVNFWASWCDTCDEEAAFLEQAWQYYAGSEGVILLGVAYVDTEAQSRRFLDQYGVTFPNGPDLRSSISDLYHVTGVPETFIIDRNGQLAYIKIGPFASLEEIRSIIDPLLQP